MSAALLTPVTDLPVSLRYGVSVTRNGAPVPALCVAVDASIDELSEAVAATKHEAISTHGVDVRMDTDVEWAGVDAAGAIWRCVSVAA